MRFTQLSAVQLVCAAAVFNLCVALTVHASTSVEALQVVLQSNPSGQSNFIQTLTAPASADGSKPRETVSSGSFAFSRPGRFRFDYVAPFPQTLVADGTTMWMYDPDLAQVIASDQATTLSNTPAALITSTADLSKLREHYALESLPADNGLRWVKATPKQTGGALKWVKLGFDTDYVVAMVMVDQFGQTSDMRFSPLKPLQAPAAKVFSFKPPAGADLIRQ
jgi:outer membrane lipoprotein carrier protein